MNEQLKILQNYKQQALLQQSKSNMTYFDSLVGIYLGVPVEEYYPKLKDHKGDTIKDEKGRDKRDTVLAGYKLVFSEYLTSKKIMVVVKDYPTEDMLQDLVAVRISGKGYDIKGSMYYLVEDTEITVL